MAIQTFVFAGMSLTASALGAAGGLSSRSQSYFDTLAVSCRRWKLGEDFMRSLRKAAVAMLAAVLSIAAGMPALATIRVQYFTVAANNRDFGPVICCFVTQNEVLNTLGPNGMPVYNPNVTGGPVLVDHSATTGELQWWTPSAAASSLYVQSTSDTTIAANSFSSGAFFPDNGVGPTDANGFFQTAIFSGQFVFGTAQTFSFTVGADDDALLFVDGVSILQVGGIHSNSAITANANLGVGTHTFELFYADRQATGASVSFSIPNNVIVTAPVPEPATWAMMIGGFGMIGAAARRRRSVLATA